MKALNPIIMVVVLCGLLANSCSTSSKGDAGKTEILKWKDGKKAAVSLTYDDGSINQFRVALPLMEKQDFRATFFINTGQIPGSQYKARFVGRPVEEIIEETAEEPTNHENLFERASAVGYLGYEGLMDYHTRAGAAVDQENIDRAIEIIDEAYRMVREGEVEKAPLPVNIDSYYGRDKITWDEIQVYAARGHEFASHTISHPRLAILDEANILWELEKCREDILEELGPRHTFSCECPYGTENERVMQYAYEIYPALRNRMPEPYLAELNRSSSEAPGAKLKEYVQWQRGPLSDTPLDRMKSWIDTCVSNENTWLVLVFHGVDGIGWEAIEGDTLEQYFSYIKSHEDDLWVATFQDVTKYMRERMTASVEVDATASQLEVNLSHQLDPELYHYPLTLKTKLPDQWEKVIVTQGGEKLTYELLDQGDAKAVIYSAEPGEHPVVISRS